MPTRYEVFLSHSSADKPAVEEIARKLREAGIEPFLDKWHLIPGDPWQEVLEKALKQSATCAVFLGPSGMGPWQNEEMRFALDRRTKDRGSRVIPVLLPRARQPKEEEIPPFLARLTWVEFHSESDEEALRQIIAGIRGEAPEPGKGARPPISDYRSMAPLPEGFVHRSEYDRVVEALCSPSKDTGATVGITTALRGAGGFGKTALAQAICQDVQVRKSYPDGILWTTMGEDIESNGRLARIRDLIRWWAEKEPPAFETVIAASAHLRKLLDGCKVLIGIDDVWSPLDVTPFQGMGPGVSLLVTTRDSQTLPIYTRRIEVDAMASKEAIALLRVKLPDAEERILQDLTRRLGEWPLLLKIVNRQLHELIRQNDLTIVEALREVGEALDTEGLTAFDREDIEDRQRAVSQTINVSLKRLPKEERDRYLQLAVFPEDVNIPLSELEHLWSLSRVKAKRICGRLYELCLLLDFDRRSETIRLHDVIRQFLIQHWGSELPNLHSRLLEVYKNWSQLPAREEYLWRYLLYHHIAAGREKTSEVS